MLQRLECLGHLLICHRKPTGCKCHGQSSVCRAGHCHTSKAPAVLGLCSSSLLWFSKAQYYKVTEQFWPCRNLSASMEIQWNGKCFPRVTWHSARLSCCSLSFIYLSFACWPSCRTEPGAYLYWGLSESLQHSDVVMTPQTNWRCTCVVAIWSAKHKLLFILLKGWAQTITCCSFAEGCQIKVLVIELAIVLEFTIKSDKWRNEAKKSKQT